LTREGKTPLRRYQDLPDRKRGPGRKGGGEFSFKGGKRARREKWTDAEKEPGFTGKTAWIKDQSGIPWSKGGKKKKAKRHSSSSSIAPRMSVKNAAVLPLPHDKEKKSSSKQERKFSAKVRKKSKEAKKDVHANKRRGRTPPDRAAKTGKTVGQWGNGERHFLLRG